MTDQQVGARTGSTGMAGGMANDRTPALPTDDGRSTSAVPSISLPTGGGAIRGIGEKFGANPVTGTGSVPIATRPGRSDFGPELSHSYDSGAGNDRAELNGIRVAVGRNRGQA